MDTPLADPNYISYGDKFYYGLPQGECQGSIDSNEYEIYQMSEKLIYSVRLQEGYNIGDVIDFVGKIFVSLWHRRMNPDYKSFMNKQGKELLLIQDAIIMTNNAGMSLELSDEEGISLISDKTITIQSDEAIEIASINDRVGIVAAENISLKQGDTQLVLKDKLTLKGAKVRLD